MEEQGNVVLPIYQHMPLIVNINAEGHFNVLGDFQHLIEDGLDLSTDLSPEEEYSKYFSKIETKGDGSCLFRALVKGLSLEENEIFSAVEETKMAWSLRSLCCDALDQTENFWDPTEDNKIIREEYIERMRLVTTHGTNKEILIAGAILQVEIVLITSRKGHFNSLYSTEPERETGNQLILLLEESEVKEIYNHFSILIPKAKNTTNRFPSQLQMLAEKKNGRPGVITSSITKIMDDSCMKNYNIKTANNTINDCMYVAICNSLELDASCSDRLRTFFAEEIYPKYMRCYFADDEFLIKSQKIMLEKDNNNYFKRKGNNLDLHILVIYLKCRIIVFDEFLGSDNISRITSTTFKPSDIQSQDLLFKRKLGKGDGHIEALIPIGRSSRKSSSDNMRNLTNFLKADDDIDIVSSIDKVAPNYLSLAQETSEEEVMVLDNKDEVEIMGGNTPKIFAIKDDIVKLYEKDNEEVQRYFSRNKNGSVGNSELDAEEHHDEENIYEDGIIIYGHNIRYATSPTTKLALNIFLDETKRENIPSVILLNECGKISSIKKLLDKGLRDEFRLVTNNHDRTATIFSKEICMSMILDKLNDYYNQIFVMTHSAKERLIIFNTYVPPGVEHPYRLASFKFKLDVVLRRFKGAKLVIFGDFNLSEPKMKTWMKNEFSQYDKLNLIVSSDPLAVTREQETINGTQRSYIDFFITNNIDEGSIDFSIIDPIANSDHKLLKLHLPRKEFGIVKAHKEYKPIFKISTKEAKDTMISLSQALNCSDPIKSLCELIREKRVEHKPIRKKAYSGISTKRVLREKLTKAKKSGNEEWKELKKMVRNLSQMNISNLCSPLKNYKSIKTLGNSSRN